jgi:hypothetical protein
MMARHCGLIGSVIHGLILLHVTLLVGMDVAPEVGLMNVTVVLQVVDVMVVMYTRHVLVQQVSLRHYGTYSTALMEKR